MSENTLGIHGEEEANTASRTTEQLATSKHDKTFWRSDVERKEIGILSLSANVLARTC